MIPFSSEAELRAGQEGLLGLAVAARGAALEGDVVEVGHLLDVSRQRPAEAESPAAELAGGLRRIDGAGIERRAVEAERVDARGELERPPLPLRRVERLLRPRTRVGSLV